MKLASMPEEPLVPAQGGGMPRSVDEAQAKADRQDSLKQIYDSFVKKRDKWVQFRASSGIEEKWKKWEAMYRGTYEEDTELNAFVNTLKNGP